MTMDDANTSDRGAAQAAPCRVQLSRSPGWRMPANTVKVDRTTRWGNPFAVHGDGQRMDRGLAVALFTQLLDKQGGWQARPQRSVEWTSLQEVRAQLRGRNLACWCPPHEPCHAQVLLRLANQLATDAATDDAGTFRPVK